MVYEAVYTIRADVFVLQHRSLQFEGAVRDSVASSGEALYSISPACSLLETPGLETFKVPLPLSGCVKDIRHL